MGIMRSLRALPSKVTEIGTQAFACCESLRQILLPAGLQQLGAGAFQSCESLTDLSVPDAIEILPHSVFSGCSSLKSVELPAHLQEMQGMAFQDCTALTAVELPETLDMIGEAAFLNCQSLTAVTVPEGVTILSPSVFADCKALASVTLPENLLEIGANAFCNCMSLADLRFPENLKSIGAYAFEACTGLHSITLPASETKVGLCAFHGCNALKQMVVRNPDCLVGTGEALTAETPENLHLTGAAQLVSADRTASAAGSADSNEDLPFDQTMAPFTLGASAQTLLFGRHDALREQAQELVEEGRTFRTVESYAKAYGYRFYETNVFSDVLENEYFEIPVAWCYGEGLTAGTDATHFSPRNTCTRCQVVTFLWSAMGRPEPAIADNPFEDVNPTDYYFKPVLWAYQNGITSGTDATHFSPKKPCTRAHVVMFLWCTMGRPTPGITESVFEDVPEDRYYYQATLWALEHGVTGGTDPTHFSPHANCVRAHVVTFLYRTFT